ncbi:uncharacterized protein LOC131330861 [Rhododendron vialii]|uniref:uncharacterized protein LOC131330861 n=1 Tax=Rhododendron vialii TaxID=182163 RepID=UPI00265DC59B|nr:uncharacterized protein LOC131330861 [Rhododendron vialii]
MEKREERQRKEEEEEEDPVQPREHQPPNISPMEPVTREAYGGGMYGTEAGQPQKPRNPPASDTQSADGPAEPAVKPKHKPPPSTGDRDVDITGQSYIQ